MAEEEGLSRARLAPRPTSVGEARSIVRRILARAGRDDLTDTAQLLVSEVVTNALVHAGTPIDLAVDIGANGLLVEVGDGSPHPPAPRSYAATAGTGRGLLLLEQMVDDWGVVANGRGKTVWFKLTSGSLADPAAHHTILPPTTTNHGAGTVEVQLLDVPVLLHAAWHQHAEALLRELLLVRLGTDLRLDGDADPIKEHAEASGALALLAEHIPEPELTDDPDQLMSDATEPKVTRPRVQVPVPEDAVSSFGTLNRTLEQAVNMADTGVFLTAPTQPELRFLRSWICDEVLGQHSGAAPRPWLPERQPPPPPRIQPLRWDETAVSRSFDAMIAADDTDEIIAVSRPALELLGYDDAAELVGRRIVAIIPERYRQAHLAGFTLHFLNGRDPLLEGPVVVPALRQDETETTVELTVRAQQGAGGKVFLAHLRQLPG